MWSRVEETMWPVKMWSVMAETIVLDFPGHTSSNLRVSKACYQECLRERSQLPKTGVGDHYNTGVHKGKRKRSTIINLRTLGSALGGIRRAHYAKSTPYECSPVSVWDFIALCPCGFSLI